MNCLSFVDYFLKPSFLTIALYLSMSCSFRYASIFLLLHTKVIRALLVFKSLWFCLTCSVRCLILNVKRATWLSGEPVSNSLAPFSLKISFLTSCVK